VNIIQGQPLKAKSGKLGLDLDNLNCYLLTVMTASFPQANFFQGGYYHIFNRGIRKQNLFNDEKDYQRYITRLKEYKGKHHISILAYCLMPNHIHLLVRQDGPEPASKFIQRLHTAYTMYFNKKYGLIGHPFQSRFKAKIVDRDEYLMHLSRYIHLNPAKLVSKLPSYKWSSYPKYLEETDDQIPDTKLILSMFKTKNGSLEDARSSYKEFVRAQEQIHLDKISHLLFPHDN